MFSNLKGSSPHYRVMAMGRNFKKMIMVASDFLMLPFALWSGYALRVSDLWPIEYIGPAWMLFCIVPVLGLVIFTRLGLYRAVVRFMGSQAILSVVKGVLILSLLLWIVGDLLQIQPFPRSIPIIFALVAFIYVGGSRLLVRSYYHWLIKHYIEKIPVLIYGAGGAGVQLASSLAGGKEYMPVAFLDDDANLWNSTVAGKSVYSPEVLPELIADLNITHVLLALPSLDRVRRQKILDSLSALNVHIKTVPSFTEIVSGESVDSLREIDLEDLLGRDPVPADHQLIAESIEAKNVMVTGAGGSIGSEICRQVITGAPTTLILYEISEYALYAIDKELRAVVDDLDAEINILPILGSVIDKGRINSILRKFNIQTVYHAAAYKHVPLVEHNVIEGIKNNIIGTLIMAEASKASGVERFVLISTDKAVRPSNVMGATKRFAELILQDLACESQGTVFSMVRFGNVLGSSGSVVPLFREQISRGGAVTVTHPDITRFFMTIPEAAALVIQAGSMGCGGDVFVLDMGKPIKITYLAERMIQLMGYNVQSAKHTDGIEIKYTGLRPGEKLYEELLIGDDVVGTAHPKIHRAEEVKLSSAALRDSLNIFEAAILDGDSLRAYEALNSVIAEFKPSSPMADWLNESERGFYEPKLH